MFIESMAPAADAIADAKIEIKLNTIPEGETQQDIIHSP